MLVTIEGIEGSGKTMVAETLRETYPDALHTGEPTDSWVGDAVRSARETDAPPLVELFAGIADHAAHLDETVRPALAAGKLVVSDRYVDSRCARQGTALAGVVDRPVEYVRGVHLPFTVEPDLTVYLDVDPETAAARSAAGSGVERVEHLRAVRENYERLLKADPGRFERVDAARSPEAVVADVEDLVAAALAD